VLQLLKRQWKKKPEGSEQVAEVPIIQEVELDVIETMTETGKVTIEFLAVDEQETGCLIRVGDEVVFIDEDESETVKGVKIFVIEAIKLHAEPDRGVCKVII